MTPSNFNWFLHTMLFIHTKRVIQQTQKKASEDEYADMDEEEEEEEEEEE